MINLEGRKRVIIENVQPTINGGQFPVKRVTGQTLKVYADIFADGHDLIAAELLYKKAGDKNFRSVPMKEIVNDRWQGRFTVEQVGNYYYNIRAWIDHFRTWQHDVRKKTEDNQKVAVELQMGAAYLREVAQNAGGYDKKQMLKWTDKLDSGHTDETIALALSEELSEMVDLYEQRPYAATLKQDLVVTVDRSRAIFSSWYELFPRSCGRETEHGTFKDVEAMLADIAKMGFDVLYLPPIHPIGKKHRKGKNNSRTARPDEPGSPWAIGSKEGGHKSIHPQLGTMADFESLVSQTKAHGMEIAMDLAFQCSPDHPYVKEHPEWFKWRPDGTVQFAENPPKKYEDIIPLNFETEKWPQLWAELKSVIDFWIEKGVRIFRVDNPHTKAFPFWQWAIEQTRKNHPDTIFLAEAFTRPKVMHRLAKIGFNQSYTYFTWRNTKHELQEYLTELTKTNLSDYFRPNFWPNTPDIFSEYLQYGGKPAFIIRLILAATLSSNYGIYGPAYELCFSEAFGTKGEYLDSEKFEIKDWDRHAPGNISHIIERTNQIRREHPALQETNNIDFLHIDNDMLLCYIKATEDFSNIILTAVNIDPYHTQSGWVQIPLDKFQIPHDQPYMLHDMLTNDKYIWQGQTNFIELNPHIMPAHVMILHRKLKRETDFDYFM